MKHLKIIGLFLFLLLIFILAVQNYEILATPVPFKLNLVFLKYESPGIPLALVAVITFLIGLFATGFYAMAERFRMRKRIKGLEKESREKDKELNSLRNLPMTTEDTDTASVQNRDVE